MPPAAAIALRESFGDRKVPDISRKITACVACRKLKIKCHMLGSTPPCTRCRSRDLPCRINKSLQTLLESDASWKEVIEQRVEKIEEMLERNPGALNSDPGPDETQAIVGPSGAVVSAQDQDQQATNLGLNLSISLGAFPASSMTSPAVRDEIAHAAYRPDLISSGVISLEVAERYFTVYKTQLDPCIHHVLPTTDTFLEVRARSSLMIAAICTVTSFCVGSADYHNCYKRFRDEVSRKMFASRYDFDDVRALCIGAFWLSDICSALNGLAVRIGTQLDLHRCITKMPHTKKACYDRTRLYFLVYLCDHHCSLVYGRPPMTREFRSLKSPGLFVQSGFSNTRDLKLISQVQYWSISRRVFKLFGADVESSAANERSAELTRLHNAFDAWYQDWNTVLDLNDPAARRTFDLYLHAGKLYLFSHVFRGPSSAQTNVTPLSATSDFALRAFRSALAIVRCITEADAEIFAWLERLPCYFGTMIAFACVTLIRTALQHQSLEVAETQETLHPLRQLFKILRMSSIAGHRAHPLSNIAKSLETAMNGPELAAQADHAATSSSDSLDFNFDAFINDTLDLSFPGSEDFWMMCPEEIASS